MIIPKRLKAGDTVGVIAPSEPMGPDHRKTLEKSFEMMADLGLKIKTASNLYSNSLGYSASAKEKGDDINEMFADPEVDAVISACGGNNAFGCLEYIDYELIKRNPKIAVGLSDACVWLVAINARTGLVTYHHGGLIDSAELKEHDFHMAQFKKTLMDGALGEVDKHSEYRRIRGGCERGELVGGNLPSLCTLVGTEYFPKTEGKILFIEIYCGSTWFDTAEKYIYQLKYHGVFNNTKGIWLGYYGSDTDKMKIEDVIINCLPDYDKPIIRCDDFGHNCQSIVVPIGGEIVFDADNLKIEYLKA